MSAAREKGKGRRENEADGVGALVTELVEGEDLAERLTRGPIPLVRTIERALTPSRPGRGGASLCGPR